MRGEERNGDERPPEGGRRAIIPVLSMMEWRLRHRTRSKDAAAGDGIAAGSTTGTTEGEWLPRGSRVWSPSCVPASLLAARTGSTTSSLRRWMTISWLR